MQNTHKQLICNILSLKFCFIKYSSSMLVCRFTGLAFSDIKTLKQEHLALDNEGITWIRKPRVKTKNMCNIPLMEVPMKILEKYKDYPVCVKRGVLLPVPANQKMNAYLKETVAI